MSDSGLLDRGYAEIMRRCIATGQAPHYTELAASLGIPLAEARSLIHELVTLTPGWVHPGTDLLASFPPFNLQPTQYRVSVDGDRLWFAQCGFEALAIRWLFPGRLVRIEAPCLCCGKSLAVEMTDETIATVDPDTVVGYTASEVGGDPATRPFR
jgi:hypothetical protein